MGEPADLPYIRVQLMLQKKDEVTEEFFHNYWKTNHVKLALENKKFVDKVIRYNQVRARPCFSVLPYRACHRSPCFQL